MSGLNLEQAAGTIAGTLVTTQIGAARTAYAALCVGQHPEALHDLRVALRRMRSLLRAYRSELQLRKRSRRELRDLAATTNPARDAEVLLILYSHLPLPMTEGEKPGVAWVGKCLRDKMHAGALVAREALDADLERLCRHVERGLAVTETGQQTSWRTVLNQRLETAWTVLDAELQILRNEFSMDRAHRARIETKRLRYLIEPLCMLLDPAKALVTEAKKLQTLLGDLHDIQVFGTWLMGAAETAGAQRGRAELAMALNMDATESDEMADTMPGLMYLGKRVYESEQTLTNEVKAWLAEDGLSRLEVAVRAMRQALKI